MVGAALGGAHGLELGVHGGEAFAVYYGVVGAETGEGVDVGVGVVLLEAAVV